MDKLGSRLWANQAMKKREMKKAPLGLEREQNPPTNHAD
jgi:hypothetical protein